MIILTVMYPKTGTSRFDLDYYLQSHIALVKNRFGGMGLEDVRLMRGAASLDGAAPDFELIGELRFLSQQHLGDALGKHGQEIIADIANFTDVQPLIQINELL